MDELIFNNKKYISSKRAGQLTGYTTDYVGQLCRDEKVDARLVGRNWYIEECSIVEHKQDSTSSRIKDDKDLSDFVCEPVSYVDETCPAPLSRPKKSTVPIRYMNDSRVLYPELTKTDSEVASGAERSEHLSDINDIVQKEHENTPATSVAATQSTLTRSRVADISNEQQHQEMREASVQGSSRGMRGRRKRSSLARCFVFVFVLVYLIVFGSFFVESSVEYSTSVGEVVESDLLSRVVDFVVSRSD